jgi:hypothetical protein
MNNLIWSDNFTIGLLFLVGAVTVILGVLKTSGRKRKPFYERSNGNINRRKIKTNPNIVCGFPVYQKAREEAPFF